MKKIAVFCTLVLCMVMAVNVSAAVITLNTPNSALSVYTGPYASVEIILDDSTHASVTFTGLTSSGYTFILGNGGIADLNVNSTSFSATDFSWIGGAPDTFIPMEIGSGQVSDFGIFNLKIKSFDGYTRAVDSVSFDLTNLSGTWSADTDVLTPNGAGFSAAAHIFVDGDGGALATGFVANGTPVPEPGTMLLLGSGLVGLAGWGRKKFRK